MSFPNFKDKYLQEASFHPDHYVKYKRWQKNKIPKKIILSYQDIAEEHFINKYHPEKCPLYRLLTIYTFRNIGFVKMTGIGAPNAVTVFEELIALGGREFLNIGTAGGLHREGIFLCEKALRDEGTSHHYLPKRKFSFPDSELTKRLESILKERKIKYNKGATWTIDAPYRETKAEIEKYSRNGISTVEMEAAALFAVAKYRKVKIAALFVVSDVLEKSGNLSFISLMSEKHKEKC